MSKALLLMWIITSFKYFTEFSLCRQFHECAKIISDCVYRIACIGKCVVVVTIFRCVPVVVTIFRCVPVLPPC